MWAQQAERVEQIERVALKPIHCHVSNRQLVGSCPYSPGSSAWCPATTQRGGGSVGRSFKREGTDVYLRLIHVVIRQKPIQHYKTVILQLKTNKKYMTSTQIRSLSESG